MTSRPKLQPALRLPDYGDPEINKLAQAQHALEQMNAEERARALKWFKARFTAAWPSDSY